MPGVAGVHDALGAMLMPSRARFCAELMPVSTYTGPVWIPIRSLKCGLAWAIWRAQLAEPVRSPKKASAGIAGNQLASGEGLMNRTWAVFGVGGIQPRTGHLG